MLPCLFEIKDNCSADMAVFYICACISRVHASLFLACRANIAIIYRVINDADNESDVSQILYTKQYT